MTPDMGRTNLFPQKPILLGSGILMVLAIVGFVVQTLGGHPGRAWQAYLINFLFWSAIAQGAVVFSAVMHLTRARWSGRLAGAAESFMAFFPVSFVLFLGLLLGQTHLFPWLGQDLHGKEAWLNPPFLFARDGAGLLLLYGLGFVYVYNALGLKRMATADSAAGVSKFFGLLSWPAPDEGRFKSRMTVFGILYILVFALVLSLLGYDLVMGLDPHWYSTLFGAYTFVKAFYVGVGGIIILAAVIQLRNRGKSIFSAHQFLDIGKLFFAFCLVWADFFYCQLVVIWYGNIPEETAYVIERVLQAPFNRLAWLVFAISFILPFLVLINRKIKTMPKAMIVLCTIVLVGIWLEHLLLIGPVLGGHGEALPLSGWDGVVGLGYLGAMAAALVLFLNRYPALIHAAGVSGGKQEAH